MCWNTVAGGRRGGGRRKINASLSCGTAPLVCSSPLFPSVGSLSTISSWREVRQDFSVTNSINSEMSMLFPTFCLADFVSLLLAVRHEWIHAPTRWFVVQFWLGGRASEQDVPRLRIARYSSMVTTKLDWVSFRFGGFKAVDEKCLYRRNFQAINSIKTPNLKDYCPNLSHDRNGRSRCARWNNVIKHLPITVVIHSTEFKSGCVKVSLQCSAFFTVVWVCKSMLIFVWAAAVRRRSFLSFTVPPSPTQHLSLSLLGLSGMQGGP